MFVNVYAVFVLSQALIKTSTILIWRIVLTFIAMFLLASSKNLIVSSVVVRNDTPQSQYDIW